MVPSFPAKTELCPELLHEIHKLYVTLSELIEFLDVIANTYQ